MAAVALCGYGLSSTGTPAKPARASAVSLNASATPPLPKGNPAEGHSPRLQQELSGSLTGTGVTRPGSAVRMSTSMQAATASAAGTMLNGVDVASFQHPSGAAINWASVASAGNHFAAIKATEVYPSTPTPGYYVNPYYVSDAQNAVAAGLYVSPYAFANPNVSGTTAQSQADFAVQNAAKAQNATSYKIGGHYMPIMLDIEYNPYGSECYGLSATQMVSWISGFVAEIKTKTGTAPLIYTTQDWWSTCTGNNTAFGGDLLWVASWSAGTPGTLPAGWNTWTMWQYTSKGTVNGIPTTGNTDLDYFSGGPQAEQTTVNTPASIQIRTLNALAGQTVSYTATGLPTGVTMSSSGLISGTPTATGTYQVTVTPSSSTAVLPASVSFTWQVIGTMTVTSPGNQSTTAGSAVDLQVSASASVPTFTATGLPPGLSISSSGLISGWPYTPGTYSTTVKATDSTGASGSASFTWTVSQAGNSGPTGRVVLANGGKCLDDTGSSTANGNKIQIWTCTGGASQRWTVVQDGTLRVFGKCLDVSGGGTANGTAVQLWSCGAGNINQRWQVGTDGELINVKSGKCLDDPYSRTASGTKLDIWSCNGGSQQHWTLPAAPLASGVAGKCLDDTGSSTVNGNKIQIYTCNGGTSQNWTVEPDGTVRVLGKCLDVTGYGTASGTKLQLYSCAAGDVAQRWQVAGSGELVNPNSGKCLADPADSTVNGTQAEIETCPSAADPGTSWHVM
jgi:GH25 family lysozyme M1 (1,4-beta-N-acetylmuramidase)